MATDTTPWMKAQKSNGSGACVEARRTHGAIEVRNSKKPELGSVFFTFAEWDAFLDGAKKDEFDVLLPH